MVIARFEIFSPQVSAADRPRRDRSAYPGFGQCSRLDFVYRFYGEIVRLCPRVGACEKKTTILLCLYGGI